MMMIRSAFTNTPTGCPPSLRHRGFILISSLFMLIVLTLVVVAMAHSFRLEASMAGNVREKARALNVAQSTLTYAEWWLTQNADATQINCTAIYTTPQICSNITLASGTSAATLPWTTYVSYTPPQPSSSSSTALAAVSTTGGTGTYYAKPGFNIQYLGNDTTGNAMFQVTAFAYGGNQSSVAVVQTIYKLSSKTKDLGAH